MDLLTTTGRWLKVERRQDRFFFWFPSTIAAFFIGVTYIGRTFRLVFASDEKGPLRGVTKRHTCKEELQLRVKKEAILFDLCTATLYTLRAYIASLLPDDPMMEPTVD